MRKFQALGQSFWLDYIRRDMICSGALRRLIEKDGLRGITSNPTIFEKSISGNYYYDDALEDPLVEKSIVQGGREAHLAHKAPSHKGVMIS